MRLNIFTNISVSCLRLICPLVISRPFRELLAKFSDVLTPVRRGKAVNLQYVSTIAEGCVTLHTDFHHLQIAYTKDTLDGILAAIEVL